MEVIQSNLLFQTGPPSRLGKAAQHFCPSNCENIQRWKFHNTSAIAFVCKIRFPLYCEGTVIFLNSLIMLIITLNQYLSNIYIFVAKDK